MNKKMIFLLMLVMILTMQACNLVSAVIGPIETTGFQNGQTVITTKDVAVWQCPGGKNAGGDPLKCVEQRNFGAAQTGLTMVVCANEFGEFADRGYLRVRVTGLISQPSWAPGQTIVEDTTIGWIDASMVK
jgi:hypothetical protein